MFSLNVQGRLTDLQRKRFSNWGRLSVVKRVVPTVIPSDRVTMGVRKGHLPRRPERAVLPMNASSPPSKALRCRIMGTSVTDLRYFLAPMTSASPRGVSRWPIWPNHQNPNYCISLFVKTWFTLVYSFDKRVAQLCGGFIFLLWMW